MSNKANALNNKFSLSKTFMQVSLIVDHYKHNLYAIFVKNLGICKNFSKENCRLIS